MTSLNPKDIVRPISLLVDSKGSPKAFFEASSISVSSIFANQFSGLSISSLSDVELTYPITNSQVLKFYAPTQKWINSTDLNGSGGGSNPFGSIGYVQFNDGLNGLSGLSTFTFSGQTLYVSSISAVNYLNLPLASYATTALYATTASLQNYETTAYARANYATTANLAISGLNDVDDTLPSPGYSLVWNGSMWTPSAVIGGAGAGIPGGDNTQVQFNSSGNFSGSPYMTFTSATRTFSATNITASSISATVYKNLPTSALSGLSDTQISSLTAGKSLIWNGSKWIASSLSLNVTGALAHYGSFTNSATLSATVANAPNYVKYLITEEANGVILAGLTPDNYYSSLKFEHAGTYNVQFSLQVSNIDNTEHFLNIWARINDVDVPRTNTKVTVPKTAGGAVGTVVPAWNYIFTMGVDDTFQLMYAVDDTRVVLPGIPALTSPYVEPATPSVIITAQQVVYLQTAADTSASFLTLTSNTGLSQERVFTTGGGLGSYDGGANSSYIVSANYTSAIWQPSSSFGTANQTISALGNLKVNQNLSAAAISSTSITALSSTANTFIETPTTFFVSQGDAQNRRFVMRNQTTLDGTPTSLYIDGSSILAKIPTNTIWHVNARVVCRTDSASAKYAAFERKCLINRNSSLSSTSILGPVQVIGSDIGSDTGSPPVGWDVNLYADSTNGALDIKVTGTDSDTIRWVAEINLVEVAFN